MNLSRNLTLGEVTRSATADRLGIKNDNISPAQLESIKTIATNVFQPIRDKLGAIRVSSGFRSLELNKAIGGAVSSQHSKGEALDLQGIHFENNVMFTFIKNNLEFDQLIWEFGDDLNPDWVHVSYAKSDINRMQVLKSVRINGRVIYEKLGNKN